MGRNSRKKPDIKFYSGVLAAVVLAVVVVVLFVNSDSKAGSLKGADTEMVAEGTGATATQPATMAQQAEEPAASTFSHETHSDESLLMTVVPAKVKQTPLEYTGFMLSFNPDYHQPNWVGWELTRKEAASQVASRSHGNFMADDAVEGCATLDDYRNSGYDRGHMAPAGDMKWDKKAMMDCFYLTNMSPQAQALNTGTWKSLEEKCRSWALRDSAIMIVCGPVLTDKLTKTIGETKVPVPERYFKVVLAPYANPPRAIGFIMNNGKVQGGMQAAAVSVDEVERVTGFDFFSALPDSIENVVEAECNFPLWNQR